MKVDDLDLTKDAGVRTANRRLESRVDTQCPDGGRGLDSQRSARDCRTDLLSKGRNKIAAAAAQSEADKLAEERHLAEVSIHPRRVRRAAPTYRRTPGNVAPVHAAHRPAARHQAAPHKAVRHQAAKHPAPARHPAKAAPHRKRR